MNTLISLVQARLIASEWHGGQWSDLYSFSSTGKFHSEAHAVGVLIEIAESADLVPKEDTHLLKELSDLTDFTAQFAGENA